MTLKRTLLKKGGGLKKGKSRLKVKPKSPEKKAAQQKQFEEDLVFYLGIWERMELPRRCFETGKLLPSEPNLTLFHHCLYKSVHPEFRHLEENIVVVLSEVHAQTHFDIDKTPKIKAYTEKLRSKLC